MSMSNYLEENFLNAAFNETSFGVTGDPFISLHDGDPGETGANEIVGGSYGRQQTSFAAASGGAVSSDAAANYTDMPECKSGGANGQLSHVGVWDAETNGNFLWGGALETPKDVNAGDTFNVASGDIDVTLD
jgi:hypothetical protein